MELHHLLEIKTVIRLLMHTPASDEGEGANGETRFGGKPSAPAGAVAWPTCSACEGHMQFLGQLRTKTQNADALLLLFMCQNDPGLCDEWDPDEGGNKVIAVACDTLQSVNPPEDEHVIRPVTYGAVVVEVDRDNYDDAREEWINATGKPGREVLGQIGGQPAWIQGDEVPACDECGSPMSFVAQLEQGPYFETEMNFGGGCAYVFECQCDVHRAKMLWQC